MNSEKEEKDMPLCPVGRFFAEFEKNAGEKSKFFEHLTRSRVEFFKAVRALVDQKIEDIEKKGATEGRKKMTKIKVK